MVGAALLVYSFIALLVGYLADVDFGSEKLRFLGGARFDVYGFFRALAPRTFMATVSSPAQSPPTSYYSICYSVLPFISPTFALPPLSVSSLTSSNSLFGYLLSRRLGVEGDSLKVEVIGNEEKFSIDGEPYKGNLIKGELVREKAVFTWD